MNKENNKKTNKKLYIALLICTVVAIIAIVATSVAIGLTSGGGEPVDDPGTITTPDDPQTPDDPSTPQTPDDPSDTNEPDEPDEPTVTTPEYGMPLASYTLGQECKLTELVWSNTLHWYSTHNGTDFMADAGTQVNAVYDGTVTSVKYTTQEGYVVTIEQSDGLTAIYKSLSADTLVEEGDAVTTGTPIGYVSDSMTCEQNDGAHLHLEMKDADGGYVDPMTKLPDGTEK